MNLDKAPKPTVVLLAGPNGAGKPPFINRFLRRRAEVFRYVNLDEVARGLTGAGAGRDLAAGPLVLERLDALFADRADVVLETTLASRSHALRIREWKAPPVRAPLGRRMTKDTGSSWSICAHPRRSSRSCAWRAASRLAKASPSRMIRGARPRHPGGHAAPPFRAQPRLSGDGLQTHRGSVGGLCEWRRGPGS